MKRKIKKLIEDICVSRGYLTDWYQQSIDESVEPIWTDAHLDELHNDFYLIPKNNISNITLFIDVCAAVRYYEDGIINNHSDSNNDPEMPCVNEDYAWCPIIDAETGQIINWKKGNIASLYYKVCDECKITIRIGDTVIYNDENYVPDFLCPKEEGYGDYIIMDIDENGFINNWNKNNEVEKFLETNNLNL